MSDLDALMDCDPLQLTSDPAKLDALIAHYRERRAAPKGRAKKDTSGPQVDLSGILDGLIGKPAAPAIRRR
ncbi:MAG: hypothetical protein KGL39_43565 [Patescibacteria group bacterium]|nr:hypothetical protein [Patescibacteria group bacterium]